MCLEKGEGKKWNETYPLLLRYRMYTPYSCIVYEYMNYAAKAKAHTL